MRSESVHSAGFLLGESFRSDRVEDLVCGDFDLAILASSWDKRSVCIADATDCRVDQWIHLTFEHQDSYGWQELHRQQVHEFIARTGKGGYQCLVDSLDVNGSWSTLWQAISEVYRSKGHPLRVLLDLSVCPRYLALASCAMLLARGMIETVSVFYAEGIYPVDGQHELLFTGGPWTPLGVPGLVNVVQPDAGRLYVVALGFEGDMTLRTVARGDPDRVSVLFPDPGTQPEYLQHTLSANKALIDSYLVPESQTIRAPAGDAIGAWRALSEAAVERDTENVSYLCCGTKPHALGVALRCIAKGKGTVLYCRPEDHRVVETKPSGVYWRFDLQDITSIR